MQVFEFIAYTQNRGQFELVTKTPGLVLYDEILDEIVEISGDYRAEGTVTVHVRLSVNDPTATGITDAITAELARRST